MLSGFIFLDIHKKQGRSLSNSGHKIQKKRAGKYTWACAPLARKYTNAIFESKDGTISTKIVNQIERHNFCLNDLLTKSNHTEIQTYSRGTNFWDTLYIVSQSRGLLQMLCTCTVYIRWCYPLKYANPLSSGTFKVLYSFNLFFYFSVYVSLVMFV